MSASSSEPTPASRTSKKLLAVIIAAVVVAAGGAAAAYFVLFANQSPVAKFASSVLDNVGVFNATESSDPDGRIVKYAWQFGDGATGEGVDVTHEYLAEGDFDVALTVTDDDGSIASTLTSIIVSLLPVPLFVAEADLLTVSVDASEAFGLSAALTSYAWDWGDGNTSAGVTATHTYASGGVKIVRLTVTDGNGKTRSSEQRVSVDPTATVYTRMYDFCEPTFKKYWEIRRGTYGDKIIRNIPPAVEEYPWGFDVPTIGNKDTALYCLLRMSTHARNQRMYNMSSPVYFPFMARYDALATAKGPQDTTGESLADLAAEDGTSYVVGPGQTMWLDAFDIGGHTERLWSAAVELRYSTDAGLVSGSCRLAASPCVRWSLQGAANDTSALGLKNTGGSGTQITDWLVFSAAKVSAWGAVAGLNLSFKNPDATRSVHIDAVRVVVFYEAPAPSTPQGQVDLDWRMTYATEESQAALAAKGYTDTTGQDDGFITDLQGTYTMDYETSQLLFGVSGDPAAWWSRVNAAGLGYGENRTSAIEAAWSNWFEWNGNYKYDVYNGFEWFFQIFIFELNGTVAQAGGTNTTTVSFRLVSWGGETLLARWHYWGSSSYMTEPGPDGVWDPESDPAPDDVPSIPNGWCGEELFWSEDMRFTATITDAMDFDFSAVHGYQMGAAADPGPDDLWKTADDEPIWFWMAMLMDYVQNSSAHPRGEMRWYLENEPEGYLHNVPGSYYYGQMYQYDISPARWDLKAGETLVLDLPRGLMIWFDPVRSVWDPAGEGGKGAPRYVYYFAPLTIKRMEPDNVGLWDDVTKSLSMAGPLAMPNDGNPPLYGFPFVVWKPVA